MENWFLDTHFKTKAVPDIHMKNLRQPSVDSCFLFRIILIEVLYMQQTNIKKKLKNNQTYAMIATENLFISVTRMGEIHAFQHFAQYL